MRGRLAIVGGGIIGLATAAAALRRWPDLGIVVLEKEGRVGAHQSGRNSGVVHSGVYYRPGSDKARLCTEGAASMARFCQENDLPLARCGKIVVAADRSELPALQEIHRRGVANGVRDLALLGPEEIREIEPLCRGVAALHVPHAAVADYGAVTAALARQVTRGGGAGRAIR